jgi:flagellar basal body rod protein FlgG
MTPLKQLFPLLLAPLLVAACSTTAINPPYALHSAGFKKALPRTASADPRAPLLRDLSQGVPFRTNNPLDLCIHGNGFFRLNLNGQLLFTRNGNFTLNEFNQFALASNPEARLDPPICVPTGADNIKVTALGRVSCVYAGVRSEIGQIELADFSSTPGLTSSDGILFTCPDFPTIQNPGTDGVGTLQENALESPNDDPRPVPPLR